MTSVIEASQRSIVSDILNTLKKKPIAALNGEAARLGTK